MARKHNWKRRKKQKIIEVSITMNISEGDIHLWICDMLHRGLEVNQKSLMDDLKDYLRANGESMLIDPGGIPSEYEPFINTATFLFRNIFGFKPEKFHPWIQEYIK